MIRGNELFSRAGFSVFDGMEVAGLPVRTIRRGEVVYQNDKITARPGSGQLLKRKATEPL